MKTIKLTLFFFLFPLLLTAQDLTGFWTGTLTNDTTKLTQHYELALSEYRGKVTGYSYTTFIANDTFYYSIKRMKATKKDSVWIVEDDKMVLNNFPERANKGVRQINTFRLNKNDSSWIMDGKWKTTQTKKYYSISGTMEMKVEEDPKKSTLIAHLEELKIENPVVFYQPAIALKKNEPVFVRNEPIQKPIKEPGKTEQLIVKTTVPVVERQKTGIEKQPEKKQEPVVVKTEPKKEEIIIAPENKTVAISEPVKKNPSPVITLPKEEPKKTIVIAAKKVEPTVITPTAEVVKKKEEIISPAKTEPTKSIKALPDLVSTRKNETIQNIYFKTDSLVLALYDNGVVDGDTVSVFINGENIILKQKLKEAATKKTFYIPQGVDSLQLILYADNMGSIPPNTGLMVIRDGEDRYEVRFSADMQKNAAITFRRKQIQ
jgi:hypothetical protein